jgi:Concanavalin A-like lectin/glucanases superfamily
MAYYGSPKIVTNGLVFYWDSANPKSWKGKQTTNYVTNAATMSSFNNYSNGPTSTFVTEFGTTGWRMTSAGSWNGCYQGISLPSTGTYTFSAWYRYWGGSSNNNGATCYVSGWGGGDSASALDKSKIGIWQRVSITLNCTTTSMTLYLISYGGTNNADNSTWEVTMPQVEAGSFATPFVAGSRANTDCIIDLTKNYQLATGSLTYASDNTFSFNGSGDYIELYAADIITGTNPFTFECFYTISGNGSAEIFGNYGPGYTAGYVWISGRYGLYISGSCYFPGSPLGVGTYHMACTRDSSGNCVLYKNGVQVNTGVLTASVPVGPYFRIGKDTNTGGEDLNGTIYSQKVYNRVLSAAEITQNFEAHRGRYGL